MSDSWWANVVHVQKFVSNSGAHPSEWSYRLASFFFPFLFGEREKSELQEEGWGEKTYTTLSQNANASGHLPKKAQSAVWNAEWHHQEVYLIWGLVVDFSFTNGEPNMPKNTASERFFQEKYFANVSKMLSLGRELLTHTHACGHAHACAHTHTHTPHNLIFSDQETSSYFVYN